MPERLKGKKILVTRPREQADTLCNLIECEGGTAIRLPVIEIKTVPDEPGLRELLAGIADYDIGIFISQNAVRHTLELLNKDMHALFRLHIIAIGKSTAGLLKQAGITKVEYADERASSEKLLELPVFNSPQLKGSRVIIFRGTGGREYLANRLTERGAIVDYLEVYQRVACKYDNTILDRILFTEKPGIIVITSSEGLQNLVAMLSSRQRKAVLDKQLLVMGKRMSKLAHELGFTRTPVIVEETSDQGLLNAMIRITG